MQVKKFAKIPDSNETVAYFASGVPETGEAGHLKHLKNHSNLSNRSYLLLDRFSLKIPNRTKTNSSVILIQTPN